MTSNLSSMGRFERMNFAKEDTVIRTLAGKTRLSAFLETDAFRKMRVLNKTSASWVLSYRLAGKKRMLGYRYMVNSQGRSLLSPSIRENSMKSIERSVRATVKKICATEWQKAQYGEW